MTILAKSNLSKMSDSVRTVLLTGGSSGIGAATAAILCDSGMTVYAASRSGKAPEGYEGRENLVPVVMDVNDEAAIKAVIERIVAERGSLDAVVCNAGNGIAGPVEETSVEEVESQFSTTFYGVVKTIQACLPGFRDQGHGRIVTISSVAAVAPLPFQGFYSCAKAGILQLTKVVSMEAGPFGVQTCCILPGDVKTGFTKARKVALKAQDPSSPYHGMTVRGIKHMEKDEQKEGMPPKVIADAVLRQLKKRRMKPEVTPSFLYGMLVWAIRRFPQSLVLKVIWKMYS